MSQPVAVLVASYELDAIEAYLQGGKVPSHLSRFFDALDICDAEAPALHIAVAQILLGRIEDQLPQWMATRANGDAVVGRQPRKRIAGAEPLTFHPQLVVGIDWACSGPGFGWPELYHVTRIPGFDRCIVTASRDSSDAWGCTDHAIGHFSATAPIVDGAREVITAYWDRQAKECFQERWWTVIDDGLIDCATARQWGEDVWGPDVEPSDYSTKAQSDD